MTFVGQSLLLAAHLVCVNVAAGGPIVAAWLDSRASRGEPTAPAAAIYLARASLVTLLIGGVLGAALGWLKWDAEYSSLWLGPLSYKLAGALFEIAFSLVLLVAWWLCLPATTGSNKWLAAGRGLMALLAATNLLYHFPLLFSVAARLADGEIADGVRDTIINGATFRQLMRSGGTPALAIHVVLASLAMAGMMLVGLALRWDRRGKHADGTLIARWGARWALAASLLQLPVGLWTLMTVPADTQSRLLGEDALGLGLFAGSMLAAFWLLSELAKIALGETSRSLLIRSMIAMLVTITLMTAMQQQARLAPKSATNQTTERSR